METIQVKSWSHFSELLGELGRDPKVTWLFRGLTKHDHSLIPKIGRTGARKDPSDGASLPHSEEEEKKAIALLKRTARPFLTYEPQTTLEWFAVAQHYGMPTRLLGWTESPLVAAYFAMEKAGTVGAPGIYALKAPPVISPEEENDPFNLHEVKTYYPPNISPRIQAQRSVFTVHPCPATEFNPEGLSKWVFPVGRPCFEIKLIIDRIGFNRASLFPDLQGLTEYVGWCYKWGRLV